jgi:hypothetical protein
MRRLTWSELINVNRKGLRIQFCPDLKTLSHYFTLMRILTWSGLIGVNRKGLRIQLCPDLKPLSHNNLP